MYLLPEDIYYTPIVPAIILKATDTKWGKTREKVKKSLFPGLRKQDHLYTKVRAYKIK